MMNFVLKMLNSALKIMDYAALVRDASSPGSEGSGDDAKTSPKAPPPIARPGSKNDEFCI